VLIVVATLMSHAAECWELMPSLLDVVCGKGQVAEIVGMTVVTTEYLERTAGAR
jgi:hypothetical protein